MLEDADIDKIQVPSIVSISEKKYKYLDNDDYIIKPIHLMPPKTSEYIKCYDGETKWIYFLIEDGELLKNIMIFAIKSGIV